MKYSRLILENRVEDFKSLYGRKFSKDQIDRIVKMIQPKFLNWVGKTFDSINFDKNFESLYKNLKRFEKISSNLPLTDINSYKSPEQLKNALEEYSNKSKRQYKKVEGGNVVYEDNRFFVVNPLTYDASCYYGKGTKWCTAANTDANFHKYNDDGKLFYVLDTALPTSDPYYKVAILKKFDGETLYWDAKDDMIKSGGWFLNTEILNKINSRIKEYMDDFFAEQIKIYQDKESARKERERIEKLRIQREQQRKRDDMRVRRLNNEWDLNDPNIDDEGLKAHALLEYLRDNNKIEKLSQEDYSRIREIKNQIEELNNKYEQEEDPNVELLNRVSELEDELEEYSEKIDVYHIIPIGQHYKLTLFEVIDAGVDVIDEEYAVGTQEEVDESCELYVDQLIDDIGFDGFSKGFAESYIDEDEVARAAEQIYSDDVSSNPDSYLDDSSKLLSSEQKDTVTHLKSQLERYQVTLAKFEALIDETEEEDLIEEYESKVEEIEDNIEDIKTEIEEIEDSPDGDYNEDDIESKVEELVEDVRRDPMWFINDMGLDVNDYIDRDEFIKGVIESDGVGLISPYDGSYEEINVNDTWFYVMRVN